MSEPENYATVAWTPEDVRAIRPGLSLDQARAFLERNDKNLRDRLVEMGRVIVNHLLDEGSPAREPGELTSYHFDVGNSSTGPARPDPVRHRQQHQEPRRRGPAGVRGAVPLVRDGVRPRRPTPSSPRGRATRTASPCSSPRGTTSTPNAPEPRTARRRYPGIGGGPTTTLPRKEMPANPPDDVFDLSVRSVYPAGGAPADAVRVTRSRTVTTTHDIPLRLGAVYLARRSGRLYALAGAIESGYEWVSLRTGQLAASLSPAPYHSIEAALSWAVSASYDVHYVSASDAPELMGNIWRWTGAGLPVAPGEAKGPGPDGTL